MRGGAANTGSGRNRTFFDAHFREKPISASDHRLNEPRFVRAVPQCQTYFADRRVEALVLILKTAIAPQGACDRLARNQFVAALHQQHKQIERDFLQPDRPARAR